MAVLDYKTLILREFSVEENSVTQDIVETHWSRFSSNSPEELRFLLTKRATARSLIARSKNMVDTEIGYDVIKGSQVIQNLKAIIAEISEEISDLYPWYSESDDLVSLSPELGMY